MLNVLSSQPPLPRSGSAVARAGAIQGLAVPNRRNDIEIDDMRTVDLAVMFVDIRGYVQLCETLDSIEVARLLGDYYRVVSETIISHGGVSEKFMGDGVLASFGASGTHAAAASDAVCCGFAILENLRSWGADRARRRLAPIAASVGLSYGPATISDFSGDMWLERAIVGDTVNIASRVAGLASQLRACLAATDQCVAAALKQAGRQLRPLAALTHSKDLLLKGRSQPVRVWWADE